MAKGHDQASGSHAPASGDSTRPRAAAARDACVCHGPDALSDVLRGVRLTGALFFLNDVASPWTAEAPAAESFRSVVLPAAQHLVSYHVVTRGACWCETPGVPPVRLEAGDVVVIPHGDPYALSTAPGALGTTPADVAIRFFTQMSAGELPFVVQAGGRGSERTHVFCGFLGCDAAPFNPILGPLPRLLHLRRPPGEAADRLARLVDLAMTESSERLPGRDGVLLRISELLFVEVIRRHVAALPGGQTGWLAGLRDETVGRALALMHRDPARAWTVETLAREAGLSRSALAERFHGIVGEPPMQYLMRWRMQLAAGMLAEGRSKVGAVAREVGYRSEAAFSRAFKTVAGVSPAGWRRGRA